MTTIPDDINKLVDEAVALIKQGNPHVPIEQIRAAQLRLVLPMLAKDMSYYDIKDILVNWRK